jgi:SAM-dependent methyltransferase
MAEPWYVEAFRAAYLEVYPHRDLASARRESEYLVGQGVKGRVLDLCCGSGRHCLALREKGVDAIGIDLSRDLLRRAHDLPGRLLCGDARAIPLSNACLDGAVSLFSSFGYFGEEGDLAVLSEVARVLRPRGLLVLDLMNPAHVRANLVPRSRSERDGIETEERRALMEDGRRVVKDVRLQARDGSTRAWREDVRLYDIEDLSPMLARSCLDLAAAHGDFDASPLSAASPRQILLARRR